MNKTIIVDCGMFTRKHKIMFIEDNEVKETFYSTTELLNDYIFTMAKTHDCKTVNFKGMRLYSLGIAKKLIEEQQRNYTGMDLKINVI